MAKKVNNPCCILRLYLQKSKPLQTSFKRNSFNNVLEDILLNSAITNIRNSNHIRFFDKPVCYKKQFKDSQ